MHEGDEMCRQRRYNLSPATNCAGVTKCAVTDPANLVQMIFRPDQHLSSLALKVSSEGALMISSRR